MVKNKNATKYSSHKQKNKEKKQSFATSFCLVCWVLLKAAHGLGGGRQRQERISFLRVVHSWFLMSVCVFCIYWVHTGRKREKREFKFFIDALSLEHFNLEGTWSTNFKAVNKNITNPCYFDDGEMNWGQKLYNNNIKKIKAPDSRRRQIITVPSPPIPSVFKFAFKKPTKTSW